MTRVTSVVVAEHNEEGVSTFVQSTAIATFLINTDIQRPRCRCSPRGEPMVNDAKMASKTIYTTQDVSRILQVNPRSVINWIDKNLLAAYRTPGGHRRIRREDLLLFLRKHQIPIPAIFLEDKFKILIVDDDEKVVELIRTFL